MKKIKLLLMLLISLTGCDKDSKCDVNGTWFIVTEYADDNGSVYLNPIGIIGESEALAH